MKTGFQLFLFVTAFTAFFLSACKSEIPPLPTPNLLVKHNGYWKGTAQDIDGAPLSVIINDVHVDNQTGEVVVYAQSERISDNFLLAPPQLEPDECADLPELGYVCGHPDAVYLNESGEELSSGDGSDGGAWWVKHAWVLNDESSRLEACRIGSEEVYNACYTARGLLDEDGNTQQIEFVGIPLLEIYNLRYVDLDAEPIEYYVDGYGPVNLDLQSGPLDLSAALIFRLTMTCQDTAGPLDGTLRGCPSP